MNTWTMSWSGLRTVVGLELAQRVRSKRWIWALIAWFVLIGGITWLVMSSADMLKAQNEANDPSTHFAPGPLAFGIITYFVLGMALVIAPAFTATSINGDRNAGTLATLQATRLSALELATGKLVSAWLASAVFLVVALPFIAWSMVLGNISFWQVAVTFAVVFAEVAVVCAIGLGCSALISRTAGSTLLTYLGVVLLSVISLILVALLSLIALNTEPVRVWGLSPAESDAYSQEVNDYWAKNPNGSTPPAPPVNKCSWYTSPETVTHTERIWWILVANPFVIVADAAPLPPGITKNLSEYQSLGSDPLASVRWGVRRMSNPPRMERDACTPLYESIPGYTVTYDSDGTAHVSTTSGTPVNVSPIKEQPVNVETPIWPWGLGINLLLGAVFFWAAVRRLAIPYGVLPSGTRVA